MVGGISPARIDDARADLRLGSAGYAFVFTRNGRLVSHPRREWVRTGVTVFETAWDANDFALHSVAIRAVTGEAGFVTAHDEVTGQATWIAFEQIPSVGWTLAAVLFQDDFRPDADDARHRLFYATVAGIVGALALFFAIVPWLLSSQRRTILIVAPAVATFILAVGIGVLWLVFDRYPAATHRSGASRPGCSSGTSSSTPAPTSRSAGTSGSASGRVSTTR